MSRLEESSASLVKAIEACKFECPHHGSNLIQVTQALLTMLEYVTEVKATLDSAYISHITNLNAVADRLEGALNASKR